MENVTFEEYIELVRKDESLQKRIFGSVPSKEFLEDDIEYSRAVKTYIDKRLSELIK